MEDPSYRYQMPRLTAKIEGRGNGIKTVLTNVFDISLSLNRDPAEVTKFFGCELGAQTSFGTDPQRAIVNGAHNASDLQSLLSKYIENFVLCKNCRLPETDYRIKSDVINQKCKACGEKFSCDMTQKLSTFILNQYKKLKSERSDEKDKKAAKKERKEERRKQEEETKGDEPSCPTAAAAATGDASPEKEKKHKDKKEKKSKKEKSKKKDDETSEAVAVGRDRDVSSDEEETDAKAADGAIERLAQWRAEVGDGAPVEAVIEKLKTIHTLSGLRPADRVIIFVGAYFTETAHRDNLVAKYKAVLSALTPTAIHQRHLIAAMEWLCGTRYPSLLRYFPVLLKHLYDEDLLDEDTIISWHIDYVRNEFSSDASLVADLTLDQLKISAQPFCTWLNEAKEEGEEDDEEEDDDDDEDGDDDVDIDAI